MNIAQVLVEQARSRPTQTAIVDRTRRVTFSELERLSAGAARELTSAGLSRGDRALLFCPISAQLYVVLIGVFRLGATAVIVDPSAGRAILDRCCRRVAPRAFIGVPLAHVLRLLSPAVRAIPMAFAIGRGWPGVRGIGRDADAGGWKDIETPDGDAPALITFTSGSTGEPKAVVRTHDFLLAQHRALVDSLHLRAGQIDLATLPVFVLANLASGVTSVIADADLRAPGAIDPVPVIRQIQRERPTRTVASPALLLRLAAHARAVDTPLDSFEHLFTGGAPVFARTLDALHAAAPRADVEAVYGSTEAEPIAHLRHESLTADDRAAMRAGAGLLAGRVVPGIELRIVPDRWGQPIGPFERSSFETSARPTGQAGEIVVSGAHVLRGYLDGRGDADTKFRVDGDVWHRTGDAGYLDRSGRLWLLGRCAARLDDDAGSLYPFAVECAAMEWPWVARAALAGHAGRRLLAVELDARAPMDATGALREALEWASLSDIVPVERIPLDARHNAKVDYTKLRAVIDRRRGARLES